MSHIEALSVLVLDIFRVCESFYQPLIDPLRTLRRSAPSTNPRWTYGRTPKLLKMTLRGLKIQQIESWRESEFMLTASHSPPEKIQMECSLHGASWETTEKPLAEAKTLPKYEPLSHIEAMTLIVWDSLEVKSIWLKSSFVVFLPLLGFTFWYFWGLPRGPPGVGG